MSSILYDVVKSLVKTDHKAVVVCNERGAENHTKRKETRIYRKKSPNQHAAFLQYAATLDFVFPQTETQAAFDHFYETTLSLLGRFYPERSITNFT